MARIDDAWAIAALDAAQRGVATDALLPPVVRDLEAIASGAVPRICLVAQVGLTVVGFGRAALQDYEASTGCRNTPSGWYLTGLIVAPEHRRHGAGLALTVARLDFIGAVTDEAYYFANAASIALHARLGFRERTRDFAIAGVHFAGAGGVLFEKKGSAPPCG